jgi:hypothetical protein
MIPEAVERMVEVNWCGEDLGPAMKLIPTLELEQDPDTIIVTIDDDVIYGDGWLDGLTEWSCLFPDKAIGYMGTMFSGNVFIHSENLQNRNITGAVGVELLGGYRGVAYRRKFFSDDVFDKLKELNRDSVFLCDDHFFSAYLTHKEIVKVVIPSEAKNYRIRGLAGGIYDSNTGNRGMEVLIAAMSNW